MRRLDIYYEGDLYEVEVVYDRATRVTWFQNGRIGEPVLFDDLPLPLQAKIEKEILGLD